MFLELAEKLNTINKITALAFGAWSTTLVFGLIFLLSLALAIVYRKKIALAPSKFNGKTILLVLIIILWSPMFFDNIFGSWQVFLRQVKMTTASSEDKFQSRLCVVDKNQALGGGACSLIPFAKEVKNSVPNQSSLAVVSEGFYSLFLQYYFIPNYQITTPELASYWLLYWPKSGYQLNNSQELMEIKGTTTKNWGRFQIVKTFSDGMTILKKL